MALIALALTVAGPRIGAGLGRLELDGTAQTIRGFVKLGRLYAQRTDREHYVVLDPARDVVTLLNPEMQPIREQALPGSVQIVMDPNPGLISIYIAPSGIIRSEAIKLRGRNSEIEVALQ
jgi:hypothetical protein